MSIDEEKRRLERRATAGEDPSDAERVRRAMERTGLTSAAADYLMRYLEIVEEFCGYGGRRYGDSPNDGFEEKGSTVRKFERKTPGDWRSDSARRFMSLGEARRRLQALNEEFKDRVDEKVLREGLPAEQLALDCMGVRDGENEDEAWLPSEICY